LESILEREQMSEQQINFLVADLLLGDVELEEYQNIAMGSSSIIVKNNVKKIIDRVLLAKKN